MASKKMQIAATNSISSTAGLIGPYNWIAIPPLHVTKIHLEEPKEPVFFPP